MQSEKVEKIMMWVFTTGKSLEWTTGEGRTFQISGTRQIAGCFERLFHENSHPTRRNVSNGEMEGRLEEAVSSFELYLGTKGEGEFFSGLPEVLAAADKFFVELSAT